MFFSKECILLCLCLGLGLLFINRRQHTCIINYLLHFFFLDVYPSDIIICQRRQHPQSLHYVGRRAAGLTIIQTVKPAAKSYIFLRLYFDLFLNPFSLQSPEDISVFPCTIYKGLRVPDLEVRREEKERDRSSRRTRS